MCAPKLRTGSVFPSKSRHLRPATSGPTTTNKLVTAEARRRRILQLLENEGNVKVEELAVLFEVSQVTVRKDLAGGVCRGVHKARRKVPGRQVGPSAGGSRVSGRTIL